MSDVPDPTPYERIGGEAGLRRMTQRMYAAYMRCVIRRRPASPPMRS